MEIGTDDFEEPFGRANAFHNLREASDDELTENDNQEQILKPPLSFPWVC